MTGYGMPHPGDTLTGLASYFESFAHWRIVLDLCLMAFCGGVFIVPLYTMLQTEAGEEERARTIAANNVLNALMIAAAALLAAAFYALELTVLQVLLVFALLNLPVIARLWRKPVG